MMTKLQEEKDTEDFSDCVQKDGPGKHVSFPPDEEIVSGFAECKDTQGAGECWFVDGVVIDSLNLALK